MLGVSHSFSLVQSGVDSFSRQPGEWKIEQTEEALRCWDFERFLGYGVALFDEVIRFDEDFRSAALRGDCEWDDGVAETINNAIRVWLVPADSLLKTLDYFEGQFGTVEKADEYRRQVSEARGIVSADVDFFSGDDLVDLRDQAIDDHRGGQTIECGA